uniref:Uncharacterized protein n=1 Tax=Rhizophora mucronata TaxID=61149 RepID=A0A2P2R0F6_RHIMU
MESKKRKNPLGATGSYLGHRDLTKMVCL